MYCESEDNTRLIPREYFFYHNIEQSFSLKFSAKETITYIGILFFQRDLDYNLKLDNLLVKEYDTGIESPDVDFQGPIFKHLLPDPDELNNLVGLPLGTKIRSEERV